VTAAGEVTEATSANVFLVETRRARHPPLAAGILPGVTRALVIALARRAGSGCARSASRSRAFAARGDFLTASTSEVLPVVRLAYGRAVGGGRPGPATLRLQLAYAGHVAAALRRSR